MLFSTVFALLPCITLKWVKVNETPDSLKYQSSLERVQAEERGDIGDDPGVHLTITPEVRSRPVTGSVGRCLVLEWEVLVANRAGAVGVGPDVGPHLKGE